MLAYDIKRKDLWARQGEKLEVDYTLWYKKKRLLQEMSLISSDCFFTVDVNKKKYTYASENFSTLFGYKLSRIKHIEKEGDFLEEYIHPDDRQQMMEMQIKHAQFIYSLPVEERNDYQNIFQFRMLNAYHKYVHVSSRHQVLQTDPQGRAWIIMGVLNVCPQQNLLEKISYSTLNRKTGEILFSSDLEDANPLLTNREKEILYLIQQGRFSKEIADRLNISIYTVNNHRKNILAKLKANNFLEAIQNARKIGLF